jgi:transcriptional regulatory protein LevR
MLTQNDLNKLKIVIEETFDRKFDEKFDKKFDEKFNENFNKAFNENFNAKIKPINKQLRKIQKDLTTTIKYFDYNSINHENRIRTIEKHLNFPQTA